VSGSVAEATASTCLVCVLECVLECVVVCVVVWWWCVCGVCAGVCGGVCVGVVGHYSERRCRCHAASTCTNCSTRVGHCFSALPAFLG